ncbi:hypothetical protein ACFE04_020330 [Oxalis oulophora]
MNHQTTTTSHQTTTTSSAYFSSNIINTIRLVAVATQKFVDEVAARQSSIIKDIRGKQQKLVEKDPEAAIGLFWKAINAGDRVDSALKDMAIVLKQEDRVEEAIEAIQSFRDRYSKQAQESLDNVLMDLYKLLKQKLRMIYQGEVFNGKPTKTARSHGRKFQGNMQKGNHVAAEAVYHKAQLIDPDANKACNLCLCLIKQRRYTEARSVVDDVLLGRFLGSDDPKTINCASELLLDMEH